MINTLSLNEIERFADNIYEAIIVLAKRARQINDEQKEVLRRDYEDEYDDYDEEINETEIIDTDYVKLPKPTSLALDEFLAGKIEYNYRDRAAEEDGGE